MKNVKFSIIMPCYNSEKWVTNALNSITGQTYSNWELVAVNDGSKDNTLNILQHYADTDERIKIITKENGGYTSAVNYGLDNITGDYFVLLGSDDTISTDLFKTIYNNIQKVQCLPDLIAFRTQKIIDGKIESTDSWITFKTTVFSQNTSIKQYIEQYPAHAAIFACRDTSKCFKTSLLQDLRYFGKYGFDADGIFSMLISRRATSFLSIPFDGYFWTLRSDSVSASLSLEKNIDRINNWRIFYDVLINDNIAAFTKYEKEFVTRQLQIITEVSSNIKNAIKFHRFIRNNAKLTKTRIKLLKPEAVNKALNVICFSPFIFSLLIKLKNILNRPKEKSR